MINDNAQRPAIGWLGQFILVRLLAAGKPPGRAVIDAAMKRFFADPRGMAAAEWRGMLDGALADLRLRGLVDAEANRLTEIGRAEAIDWLGGLPVGKINWTTLRNRYLVPKALGIRPEGKTEWDRLGTSDGLRAAVLAKCYGLAVSPAASLSKVLDALAWKQLEVAHPSLTNASGAFLRNNVLRATLMAGQPGRPEERLPALASGARRNHPDAIREAIILQWLQKSEPVAGSAGSAGAGGRQLPLSLQAFSARIVQLAASSFTGRFGEHKVFISHVWDRFREDQRGRDMTREEFNGRLLDANREGLITLSRADLVSAMNQADVQASEIRSPYSSFHFIRTDR